MFPILKHHTLHNHPTKKGKKKKKGKKMKKKRVWWMCGV
jgi:hypothetical protein